MAGAALREVFAIFGVQVDPEGNLDKGHKKVSGLKTAFEGAVAAFAGNALIGATRAYATQLEGLQDLSLQTGLTTDRVQQLGFMAEQNGSSMDEMGNSLLIMTRALRAGTSATGPQADAFNTLGVSLRNAAGQPKSLAEALPEVFQNFGKLKNSAEEAQVATALFGRGGVKMLPTLRQGAAGLEAYSAQLAELGGPVAADTIAKADEMNDSFLKMDRALFALKGTVGAEVFPQITKLVTGFSKGVAKISEFVRGTTLAQSGALALGVAVAGPLMSALGPLLKPGLKFAAIFLAMDDAIAFLQGKDSVIGAILNGFFGPETTEGVRAWGQTVFGEFKQVWESGTSIFSAISQGWESMLLDMSIAIDEWVLGISTKWNELASSFDLDFLKVDDTKSSLVNEEGLAERKRRRDELRDRAFREQNKGQVAREELADREAIGSRNGTGRRELSRDDIRSVFGAARTADGKRRDLFGDFGGGRRATATNNAQLSAVPSLFDPNVGTGRRVTESGASVAAPFFATMPVPPAPKVENHIDARTTVHASTNADPKQIADAVATKQKDSLRNAYTSLTSRSSFAR
jgi:hypothetical protein